MKMNQVGAMAMLTALAVTTVPEGTAAPAPEPAVRPDMSPSVPVPWMKNPQIKNKPATPTQSLPQRQTRIPEMVTYVAVLQNIQGTLPARLGGWECADSDADSTCRFRTNGPWNLLRAQELCRGLRLLLKSQPGLSFAIYKFRGEPGQDLGPNCSQ